MAVHLANPAAAAQGLATAVGSPSNGYRSRQEPVFTVHPSRSVTIAAAIPSASVRSLSCVRSSILQVDAAFDAPQIRIHASAIIASALSHGDRPICTVSNSATPTLAVLAGRSGSFDGKPSRPSHVTSAAATADFVTELGGGGGDGAGGSSGGGGSGGGGGGGEGVGGEGNAGEESNYGPILGWAQAEEALTKAGVTLPEDMLAHVKEHGIAQLLLQRYIDLQAGGGILAAATRSYAALRNRLLADPSFLFKVLTEVVIDSGCATFAEVKKRGDDFWKEIDLYTSDILVGVAVDTALVSMLAPMARFGRTAAAASAGRRGLVPPGLAAALEALPSSMFEAALPGRRYSVAQRGATWLVKGVQYAVVGFSCGLIGQALSMGIVAVKRKLRKPGHEEEDEVKIPGLLPTACLWGGFMAVSSNTRYQIINGLERIVETSPLARSAPLGARAFTVLIRFSNNIFGSSQFVEVARWSGVQ